MQPEEFMARMKSEKPPVLVDVRTGFEFKKGHIAGALHAPTWKIVLGLVRLPKEKDAELVVTCEHGPRAKIAKVLLEKMGYRNVVLLVGQMSAWRKSDRPMEK